MMANEFEISMIGELSYFLGLQIKQLKNGTFVSQGKYIKDMIKKFGMIDSKVISTPMGTNGNLDSDASGNMVDHVVLRMVYWCTPIGITLQRSIFYTLASCGRH